MLKIRRRVLCGIATMLLGAHGFAEDITRQQAEALMLECQSQRQQNIQPHKEKAIDDCINKQRRDKDYCERYFRNFGERRAGGTQPGMYWELPICEKATRAENYFKMHPGRQVYTSS